MADDENSAAPGGSDQAREVRLGEAQQRAPGEPGSLGAEAPPDLDARERNIRTVRKAMGPTGIGIGLRSGVEAAPPPDDVPPTDPARE